MRAKLNEKTGNESKRAPRQALVDGLVGALPPSISLAPPTDSRIQTRRLRELGYEHSLGVPPHAHGRILLSPGRYRMHAIYYGGY